MTSITKEAIDSARQALNDLWVRAQAIYQGKVTDKAEDEANGGSDLKGGVIITCDVTMAELDAIPLEWTNNVAIELKDDGRLFMAVDDGKQHAMAMSHVAMQAAAYAAAHGLYCSIGGDVVAPSGLPFRPDAVLWSRTAGSSSSLEPLIVLEVETFHRTLGGLVRSAILYLDQFPSVQRVVGFKVFAEGTVLAQDSSGKPTVRIPALAVVFERDEDMRIKVAHAESFGNEAIGLGPLESMDYPEDVARMVRYKEVWHHCAPVMEFPRNLHINELYDEVAALLGDDKVQLPFDVEMPAPLPPMQFDLKRLFGLVAQGWGLDQHHHARCMCPIDPSVE